MDADLRALVTLADFEPMARLAMDPKAFDYVAGGSWDEITLVDNEAAWRRRRLRPRVLVDVSRVDPSTTMLGQPTTLPLAIAPMAAHGLAHPDAEAASARAAAAVGVPFILSTMSTCSMEEVASAAPEGIRWFQLYTQADPGRTRALVQRAEAAGYGAIVLTVDLPLLGYRERDRRTGFDLVGPHGNFATEGGATHAGGIHADGFALLEEQLLTGLSWDDLATIRGWSSLPLVLKGVLTVDLPLLGYRERDRRTGFDLVGPHGNFATEGGATHAGGIHAEGFALLEEQLLTGLSWDDLATIRGWSSLPLVLKGVMTAEDAVLALDHGVDAIVVSNHGGRQLDRMSASIDALGEVAAAVGDRLEVWVDGGVRRGLDVAIAIALGARGVLIGKPIMWALAAGGQAGVERALAIVREEFEIALALLGTPTPDHITAAHVAAAGPVTA